MASIKDTDTALKILNTYDGTNPYILVLKRDFFVTKLKKELNDFEIEYIIKNYNKQPISVNKITKLADWYGLKKKEEWNTDFTPEKIKVITLYGETKTHYHCQVQYRQSVNPVGCFLPKKAVLKNFILEDYHNLYVDFDRYDKLSMSKNPDRKLKPHQKEAVQFLLSRKKCVLADDMGYGKTTELIVAAIEGNFDSVLIICPASIKSTWKNELLWYVPERDITIIEGINGKNKKDLEKYLGYKTDSNKTISQLQQEAKERGKWMDNRFVIVNYDILDEFYKIPKGRAKAAVEEAFNNSPMLHHIKDKKTLIIIDEAHRLSNNTAIKYKVIKDLIKRGEPHSIYAATGTPITNNPRNFFYVLDLLDDPITDDYQYYLDRYCNAFKVPAKGEKERWTGYFLNRKKKKSVNELTFNEQQELKQYIRDNARMINVANGESNLEELRDRTQHIYLRRVKEDLKGMVNKTIHEIYYDLTPSQQAEYNKLWEEYENAQREDNPDKELNKELIEGGIYRRYLSNQMVPNTIKLAEKLLSEGKKVVIGTCYDEELYTLQKYFGDKCVIYNGKMNSKQKDAAQKAFIDDPNVTIFLGQLFAAGVGLTLVVSNCVIFNNIDYVPSTCQQFEDRVYRIGQTKDVDIYYQFFNNTQYERIWRLVLKKDLAINSVIKKEGDK
jgi:SNF2 family DNA or RNA helicase